MNFKPNSICVCIFVFLTQSAAAQQLFAVQDLTTKGQVWSYSDEDLPSSSTASFGSGNQFGTEADSSVIPITPGHSVLSSTQTFDDSFCPPQVETKPSFPSTKVTGFFHLDSAWFSQDDANQRVLGDINDGMGFRRARLAAKGEVAEGMSYIIEFDIAQSQARFVDVWLQANDTAVGKVRIGRYRQPFGMSELTSVRELPFLERPVTFTQSPFRQTGVMLFDSIPSEQGTWAISGYRFLSDNFGNVFADSGGYGMAARLTRLLAEWSDGRLIHVGVDYSYNNPGRGLIQLVSTNEVFVGQNPNLGPAGLSSLPIEGVTPFVNTGALAAETAEFFNVEYAVAMGRMAFQSEARVVRVSQPNGNTLDFPGAYAQLRYVVTGEKIPYIKQNGVFGRIVPRNDLSRYGGIGALELLARVSHIDLIDGGINGRRLTDYTIGSNWYWNKHAKFQFNWVHSQLDDQVAGGSSANTFATRVQLDF
jgi:phosphate-selective porin OprO/OprP